MGGQSSSLPTVLPEAPSHAPEHAELVEIRKYLNHGGSAAPCRDPSFALIDGTWRNDLERQGLTVIGMIIPCAFEELRGIIRYHGAGNQPAAAGLAFIDADKTMVDYVGPRSCGLVVACAIGILAHYVLPCRGKHGRQLCVGSVTSRTVVNEELVDLGLPRDSLTPGAVVAMQVITLDSEGGGVYCSAEENPDGMGLFI
ncbi:hypothetical protein FOZ63_022960 [Perkinsus olseni]|uniref:Uncharacterized protein n=1 Tax=Perkinsus olseni TaxID=32597 RepID=A0A7J6S6J1_PEROL|nr:hypothetical protein FOZ62_009846 [Perkinsus olseni]KAF4728548.1 hypothetical protein FOZ63_022960 [Perkinsus olseni]